MKITKGLKKLWKDESGVEPIVIKLMAAIVLLAIGVGIAVGLYRKAGEIAENKLENMVENLS